MGDGLLSLSLTLTHNHTHIHSLPIVLVVMMKSKELKQFCRDCLVCVIKLHVDGPWRVQRWVVILTVLLDQPLLMPVLQRPLSLASHDS